MIDNSEERGCTLLIILIYIKKKKTDVNKNGMLHTLTTSAKKQIYLRRNARSLGECNVQISLEAYFQSLLLSATQLLCCHKQQLSQDLVLQVWVFGHFNSPVARPRLGDRA